MDWTRPYARRARIMARHPAASPDVTHEAWVDEKRQNDPQDLSGPAAAPDGT